MIDEDLTTQDVDRTFVAANYEEVDLDQNDDNSLCRYELLEMVARMAKVKYQDKGHCSTVSEATERLLQDFIIPNSGEHMPWQQFRDDRLWTLECDDLFKANMSSIHALYALVKARPQTAAVRHLDMADCIWLFNQVGFGGPEYEKMVATAYTLSKMTIVDDMADFQNYHDMLPVEFIEFLGRAADLIIKKDQALYIKLEYILTILFLQLLQVKMIVPDVGDEQDSESDCGDDLVEEIVCKCL